MVKDRRRRSNLDILLHAVLLPLALRLASTSTSDVSPVRIACYYGL